MTRSAPPPLTRLDDRDRRLLRLVLCVQRGRFEELAPLVEAAPAGEPDRAWREALLQTQLFAGIPRVVEAFARLERLGGTGALEDDERSPEADPGEAARRARGAALFARIYGANADAVRASLQGFHPLLAGWIEGHAYGRVLARPGLDLARRELLAIVCLCALDQERQLASHVRGALAVGVERAALQEAARLVEQTAGAAAAALLERALARESR